MSRRLGMPRVLSAMMAVWLAAPVAFSQDYYIPDDALIVPERISRDDAIVRGRFAYQWSESGELVLLFNGSFRLTLGRRELQADNGVVWIRPATEAETGDRFFELTVYLSGRAVVLEPAGTITEDNVLLVSNLRTKGRLIKEHDAHSTAPQTENALYQQALADRAVVEGRAPADGVGVERPDRVRRRETDARVVTFRFGNVEPAQTPDGRIVQVVTNGAYLAQTGNPEASILEIRADNAVVFAGRSMMGGVLSDAAAAPLGRSEERGPGAEPPPPTDPLARPGRLTPEEQREALERPLSPVGRQIADQLEAVYLEGDVVLTMGDRLIRANRLYYDFERDRAVILDAVARIDLPERGIPLYVRADEIRQLSAREFSAERARVTTSEFHTPHYHVGASQVIVRDRTMLDRRGRPSGPISGEYEMRNATFNVLNRPLLWWPYSSGDYTASETLIRGSRFGYSRERGGIFSTTWDLLRLMGLTAPPGYDARLQLDYFTRRGPGVGIDADYQEADRYGLWRSYYINDGGEDNFGPLRNNVPDDANRGRVLWRHRHYLPNDWEATLEFAYASDPGFLEEYRKQEWFEGKQQETVIFLKKAREVDALTLLANWRLLDFVTQTEHLPELAYRRIGDTFGPFVNYAEGRVGMVRYRPDDRRFFDRRRFNNDGLTDSTFRADGREEIELPIKLPGFNVVAFSTFRGSYWDGQPLDEGGLWRGFGLYGLRGGGYLSRVYDDFRSELFDVDRIRHVIRPYFTAWVSHSNTRSHLITPFDTGIETIDDFHGGMIGVKQVWQTKRGGPGQERTVDLAELDLRMAAFADRQEWENSNGYVDFVRPEDSRTRNHVSGEFTYRLSDSTSFLYDFNVDMNDFSYDRHNVAIAVERLPRLAYFLGYRRAGDINLDLIGGGWNYRFNEKHISAFRIWYDLDRSQLGEMSISYVRRLPRWYLAVTIDVDEVFDDVSLSVSVWPEGIPEWTLGSRRYTGLSTSTGIRP